MDAHMGAFGEPGLVVIPELGRLVLEVPYTVKGARAEHALLGAGRLFVAADADEDALILLALEESLQTFRLAGGGAGGRRQGRVHLAFRRALLDHQIEVPITRGHVAEL